VLAQLQQLYETMVEFTKHAPVFGGVLMMWIMGVITYFLRNIPKAIWDYTVRQLTTTLAFNNAGYGGNELNYQCFLAWYLQQGFATVARSYSLERQWRTGGYVNVFGAGYGIQLFIYRRRLFWFKRAKAESSATDKIKEEISVHGLTRNVDIVKQMMDEFTYKPAKDKHYAYTWDAKAWSDPVVVRPRALHTVIINADLKASLLKAIDDFKAGEQWYKDRGIPYKLVILLHGPPGSGKTTLVRTLASHYQSDIYRINIGSMSDTSFDKAVGTIDSGSFVLIEDFDSSNALKTRHGLKPKLVPKPNPEEAVLKPIGESTETPTNVTINETVSIDFSTLTLSGFLNTIDGVCPLHDTIIFMTTNDVTNIDPAVLRKGRVDESFYIGVLEHPEVTQYIQLNIPDLILDPGLAFNPIMGCDLADLYRRHHNTPREFIDNIPKLHNNPKELYHVSV